MDNVKDNEDGENPTGLGKVITERPGEKRRGDLRKNGTERQRKGNRTWCDQAKKSEHVETSEER